MSRAEEIETILTEYRAALADLLRNVVVRNRFREKVVAFCKPEGEADLRKSIPVRKYTDHGRKCTVYGHGGPRRAPLEQLVVDGPKTLDEAYVFLALVHDSGPYVVPVGHAAPDEWWTYSSVNSASTPLDLFMSYEWRGTLQWRMYERTPEAIDKLSGWWKKVEAECVVLQGEPAKPAPDGKGAKTGRNMGQDGGGITRAEVEARWHQAEEDIEGWRKQSSQESEFSPPLAYKISEGMLDNLALVAGMARKESLPVFQAADNPERYAVCELFMIRVSVLWHWLAVDHWADIEDLIQSHSSRHRVVSFGNCAGKDGLEAVIAGIGTIVEAHGDIMPLESGSDALDVFACPFSEKLWQALTHQIPWPSLAEISRVRIELQMDIGEATKERRNMAAPSEEDEGTTGDKKSRQDKSASTPPRTTTATRSSSTSQAATSPEETAKREARARLFEVIEKHPRRSELLAELRDYADTIREMQGGGYTTTTPPPMFESIHEAAQSFLHQTMGDLPPLLITRSCDDLAYLGVEGWERLIWELSERKGNGSVTPTAPPPTATEQKAATPENEPAAPQPAKAQPAKQGVPLRVVAEILQNSDAERTDAMLGRWNRARRKKPDPVGRNPKDRREWLFEPTAIVAWVKIEETPLTVPEDDLIKRLTRLAVEPLPTE